MLKSSFAPRGAWRQVLIWAALLALLIALFMLLFDAIDVAPPYPDGRG